MDEIEAGDVVERCQQLLTSPSLSCPFFYFQEWQRVVLWSFWAVNMVSVGIGQQLARMPVE